MRRRTPNAGTTLTTAALLILGLAAVLSVLFALTQADYARTRQWRDQTRSYFAAEAGVNEVYEALVEQRPEDRVDLDRSRSIGEGSFSVDVTWGDDDRELLGGQVRLRSLGRQGAATAGIEVIARAVPNGTYLHAVFGDKGVRLGAGARVDSFDSEDGPYGSARDDAPASLLGNVGSNADIVLDAGVEVRGDVVAGPAGRVIGLASDTEDSGAARSAQAPVVLDPVTVPAVRPVGALLVTHRRTIGPGSMRYSAVTVRPGGQLRLVGPLRMVARNLRLLAEGELAIDASEGPVEIYAIGDFDLRAGSTVTTNARGAKDVSVFLVADTEASQAPLVTLRADSDFTGTIYAPDACLLVGEGFRVSGALLAEEVKLAGGAELHFDTDLLYLDGVVPEYEQLSWRVLGGRSD